MKVVMDQEGIRSRLVFIRSNSDYTQKDMADALGISQASYCDIENGKTRINIRHVKLICFELKINDTWLLEGRGTMYASIPSGRQLTDARKQLIDWVMALSEEQCRLICQLPAMAAPTPAVIPAAVAPSYVRTVYSRQLPILGSTAAGPPLDYADEDPDPPMLFIADDAPAADYALQVYGDSMSPQYPDGSYILIKRCASIARGQLGIFELDGATLFKRYEPHTGGVRLISLNPEYAPIELSKGEYLSARLLGQVVGSQQELS